MEGRLTATVLEWSNGPGGPMGEVLLVEPNGDSYPFFVKIVGEETEITGDPMVLDYLEDRYSSPAVCFTCRNALLAQHSETRGQSGRALPEVDFEDENLQE